MTQPNYSHEKLEAWQAFFQTYHKVTSSLACVMQGQQNLPLTWFNVLFHLNQAPKGELRLQELAEAVDLSQSGLTRLLDRLAEAELVERKPCPHDRRGAYAMITSQGKAILEQATPLYIQTIDHYFMQHLDDADIKALGEICSKILRSA